MGISKREIMVVGALLTVLTAALVYQWRFNPNTWWLRAEGRRKEMDKAIAANKGVFEDAWVCRTLAEYKEFVCRFPKNPKAAAAWVIIAGLEEMLDNENPRALKARAQIATFCRDKQAAAEVERLLRNSDFCDIAEEALAAIAPRQFKAFSKADIVMDAGDCTDFHYEVVDSKTGEGVRLPLDASQQRLVAVVQARRHHLGRVAFVTITLRSRWTVWVADVKSGRLRAFLPSKPMPDPKKTKKPLLVWSPDGKRLTCGGETFVVD